MTLLSWFAIQKLPSYAAFFKTECKLDTYHWGGILSRIPSLAIISLGDRRIPMPQSSGR